MKQKFIVVIMKYKGTDITYRRWFDGGKEEILIDKNFAKLMGFPSEQELVKTMLKDTNIDYQQGDKLWCAFDEGTQQITSVSVSKPKDNAQ